MNKILIAIALVIGFIAMSLIGTYNGLVSKAEEVDSQWANVESKLQRRYDLIPNLVEAVKGSMKQEQEIFGQIAEARAKMAGAQTTEEKVLASNQLEGALGRLLVVMENYPELKSNQNVSKLMDELSGTENRISVERDRYNAVVRDYNKKIRSFPTNLMAKAMGFETRNYFEASKDAQAAPKVKF
ncbi:LemA protein [Alkalithermobacter thermoalcaliphilus JW-YL-7 = DSM 7308]|uniref:LemA family protein n=1 Tax=Alkalithermobacter thermoalcaliphilus JW-YL-7 = DSM 7308 TaxID=1121328 RepID=A0A150FN80_CLOPD|nr:LemA family protein [[Clostridium] paradoxum JW-YL-7 = DSM 7308]SHL04817.1 LemA protein [[Clostridium] paradoxum JW-YL-7 = DSM 7308]